MNKVYDEQRTVELSKCGFQVLRFWNNDVLLQTNTVLEIIHKALSPTLSREVESSTTHLHGAGDGVDLAT
jgi:very-short-patch-repair endonuclease